MSAPRGVELDHPYLGALEYLVEIVVGELDDVGVGRVNGHRTAGEGQQQNACKVNATVSKE